MPSFSATQFTIRRMDTNPGVRRSGSSFCWACCACIAVRLANTGDRTKVRIARRLIIASSLEDVLQRKLNLARRAARLGNLSGLRITSAVAQEWTRLREEEIRVIGQIEKLRAELKSGKFLHRNILKNRKIDRRTRLNSSH